jgi:hypothetical protein
MRIPPCGVDEPDFRKVVGAVDLVRKFELCLVQRCQRRCDLTVVDAPRLHVLRLVPPARAAFAPGELVGGRLAERVRPAIARERLARRCGVAVVVLVSVAVLAAGTDVAPVREALGSPCEPRSLTPGAVHRHTPG